MPFKSTRGWRLQKKIEWKRGGTTQLYAKDSSQDYINQTNYENEIICGNIFYWSMAYCMSICIYFNSLVFCQIIRIHVG